MNRRNSTALLGAAGGLLLAVTGLLLLDVYVPATVPSVPESPVLSEETLVPLVALAGVLLAWAIARVADVPPVVALPLGGGLAALVVRYTLGLVTGSLTAGLGVLTLVALQTLALGLAVGAIGAAGLSYPERSETAGAVVLAIAGVVIASTAVGASLSRVLYVSVAALLAGGPVAVAANRHRRPFTAGFPLPTGGSSGAASTADPTDPFGSASGSSDEDAGTAGGRGPIGGTSTDTEESAGTDETADEPGDDEAST